MKKILGSALAAIVVVVGMGAGAAVADQVGTPGDPNCHGVRVGHGSSSHELTPVARVAELNHLLALDPAELPPDFAGFVTFLQSFFGDTATVAEFHQFVKANCEG